MKSQKEMEQGDKIVAYKHAFNTEHGKIVRNDLMDKFHFLRPHKGEDAFAEGQRSVVLYILEQLYIKPEDIMKIMDGE